MESFVDSAATRFLVKEGNWSQQVNVLHLILFTLIVAVALSLFGNVAIRAIRNCFIFAMVGLIASLLSSQLLWVVCLQTMSFALFGLAASRKLEISKYLMIFSLSLPLLLGLILSAAGIQIVSIENASMAAALVLGLVVTAFMVWRYDMPNAPIALLVLTGAAVPAFLYYTGSQTSKVSNLVNSVDELSLGDFVKKLRQQIADPKIRALLNAGLEDGLVSDDQFRYSEQFIAANDLLPTQSQIDLDKSVGFLLSKPATSTDMLSVVRSGLTGEEFASTAPAITVARAGGKIYVIDGHHRWSQQMIFGGKNVMLKCMVIEAQEKGVDDPVKVLKLVQIAIAATTGGVPSSSVDAKNDVFAMDQSGIFNYFTEKGNDKVYADNYTEIQKVVGTGGVQWLTDQTMVVRTKKQNLGDLPRVAMPQLDVGGSEIDKLNKLAQGRINLSQPF